MVWGLGFRFYVKVGDFSGVSMYGFGRVLGFMYGLGFSVHGLGFRIYRACMYGLGHVVSIITYLCPSSSAHDESCSQSESP